MQAEYGIDLGDAVYGQHPMAIRRLWALLKGLPLSSALAREMYDEAEWGLSERLLGLIAEVLANRYRPPTLAPITVLPRARAAHDSLALLAHAREHAEIHYDGDRVR